MKARRSLKTDHFAKKNLQEYRSLIHYASFDTFGTRIGRILTPQSVLEVSLEIYTILPFTSKTIKITFLNDINSILSFYKND